MPDPTRPIARLSASFRFIDENVSLDVNTSFLNWTKLTDAPKSMNPANRNSEAVSMRSMSPKVSNGYMMSRKRNAITESSKSNVTDILTDLNITCVYDSTDKNKRASKINMPFWVHQYETERQAREEA